MMKSCFLVFLIALSVAIDSNLKVSCVDRSSYKVGICTDSKCERSMTPLKVCHEEGQSIQFDIEGRIENVICKNPKVMCQDTLMANRTLLEDEKRYINTEDDGTDGTEVEKPITIKPTTPSPTTLSPTTAVPTIALPDEPIKIPDNITDVIKENNKKIEDAKQEEQARQTKDEMKSQILAERQIEMLINSKPLATVETTQKFINLINNTESEDIKITSTESIDMVEYNKTDLNEKTLDGNNQEIILQFKMKKTNRRMLFDETITTTTTTTEVIEEEEITSLQMFSEVNNTIIKNLKISIIIKGSNNNNNNNLNPIVFKECGIFGKLNNVTLQNIIITFYNPITFSCSNNDGDYAGIVVNEATNSILNKVKVEFSSFGNYLLYLESDKNTGILIGKAENITINNTDIIGDSLVVSGSKEKYYGGMIGELNGYNNIIESSSIDLYFLSLYKEVNYGGLIGKCQEGSVVLNKISNYIRKGLTIGVNSESSSFSFGGLISILDKSVDISIIDSWSSIKTYGIEANSTATYFGGFIGNSDDDKSKVTIIRSYVRIYTGHKRFVFISKNEDNNDVKIGYYFGNINVNEGNLKLNETSAYVQGCTTIDCVYQPYYKLSIYSSEMNTKKPEGRILNNPLIINLVTGEGAMTVEEDKNNNKNTKLGFTNEIETFVSQTGMQVSEDGLIENPSNVQPPASSVRKLSTAIIQLLPVKTANVVNKLCENNCNNHGICQYGKCVCYPGYLPSTCLYRSCPYGTSLSNPSNEYTDEKRINYECSNQGKCNRENGLCECFAGYEGNACQRTKCPNQCSGHGICETVGNVKLVDNNMIIQNEKEYNKWDKNTMQVCVCDKEYTGADCSEKKCPLGYLQSSDCESGGYTEEKITIEKTNTNTNSDIKIDCNPSTDSQNVYLKYTDLWGRDWYTEKFNVGCIDEWNNALGRLPPGVISLDSSYGVEFDTTTGSVNELTVTIMFSKHQTGRQNVIKVLTKEEVLSIPEIQNGGTFHTITSRNTDKLLSSADVTYVTDLISPPEECSNAGICDRRTGLCNCFDGYMGIACNQASSVL